MSKELQAQEVSALLAGGMGAGLHWFPADVSAARLAEVLVAMANSSGGTVLLGVAPRSAQVQGLPDAAQALDCVFQAALLADPPLVLPVPQVVHIERQQVLRVTVPAGLPHVYSLDGRYLGREGTQSNPLPARRLRQLLIERGAVQFEAQLPPSAALDDLDPEKVAAYVQALDLPSEEPADRSPAEQASFVHEILLRRGCLRYEGGGASGRPACLRPTYAALLLFGRHPQQWLPNATILAARFTGATLADRYLKQEIAGTLPEQLRQAEAFVRDNMRSVVRLVGLAHEERPEYPFEALRELLVNAVAHRDYNLQGDNIHLYIFSDRIEVHSPGGLPGPVNLDNLLQARFSRNAVIMQVLSDLGFVERLGYGLVRVVEVLRQHDLRPPRFEETSGSFRVTLFGPRPEVQAMPALPDLQAYLEMGLNPRQEQAIAFLLQRRRITNRQYQELCPDVSAETLRRDLADLVAHGLLIKVGDKRATYYILKK